MRSLYGSILLWFAGLLVIAVAVILFSAPMAFLRFSGRGGPLDRTNLVFLRQAREALAQKGQPGLVAYLDGLASQLPARYYLLDAGGRDLSDGQDRRALLDLGSDKFFVRSSGTGIVRAYSEGGDHLVSVIQARGGPGGGLPIILLIALVAASLCWLFAARLAAPVRELAKTMDAFGRGEMAVRSSIRRKDEIGGLARSFNQMADRMEALMTAERRLLQDVSHELQSPLARLAIAAKLTRYAEDRAGAATRIQKEIDRLSQMIAGLLEITRAEGDPAARKLERIDLRSLLEDLIEDCTWEASEQQCTLTAQLQPVAILGNSELIRRALDNVLRNAIRFSPPGEAIDITLASEAGIVVASFRDRGPGVPEESLERIFAPFFRVDTSRNHAKGGTGLGLSLAQRAVLLHRGTIHARNAQPGLMVTISLPEKG